jgi:hypothetical protein
MLTDADSALEFIEAFAEFARRIGKHGRAVYHVRFDYMVFGSWVVEAGTSKKRVRLAWDGKESNLAAQHAVYPDSRSRPELRRISDTAMRDASQKEIFATAEAIILAN